MAQTILRNKIRDLLSKSITLKSEIYLKSDLDELLKTKKTYDTVLWRAKKDWEGGLQDFIKLLNAIIASDDRKVVDQYVSRAVSVLTQLEQVPLRYKKDLPIARRKLRELCKDFAGYVEDYKETVTSSTLLKVLKAEKELSYTQAPIGTITMPIDQVLKRINVKEIIDDLLNQDITAFLPQGAPWPCKPTEPEPEEILFHGYTENSDYNVIGTAVSHISDLGFFSSRNLERFHQLMRSVLNIEVDLEVTAPDTSKDLLVAELYELCDSSNPNKHRMIAIGRDLGFTRKELIDLSPEEICQKIKGRFAL